MRSCMTAVLTAAMLLTSVEARAEYEARAVIKALDRAVLSSELAAKVARLPLRPGDAFAKGDVLVALDCELYEAQAAKVSAEVKASRIKRDNARELKAFNSIGELDVALAQSEYAQALAEQRIARLNTERCNVHAPWDGRIVGLMVRAHENIRQQQELIEIVGDRQLEAEVVVPAAWLGWLAPGQPIELTIDDVDVVTQAKVTAITPAIDAVSQTVLLRATLMPGANLIPGMSAVASFQPPIAQ